jgi:hypothetical protein
MKLRSAKHGTSRRRISGVQVERRTRIKKKSLSKTEARKAAIVSAKEEQITHEKRSNHVSRKQDAERKKALRTELKTLASPVSKRASPAQEETNSIAQKPVKTTEMKSGAESPQNEIAFLDTQDSASRRRSKSISSIRSSSNRSSSSRSSSSSGCNSEYNRNDYSGSGSSSSSSEGSIERTSGKTSGHRMSKKLCNSSSFNSHEKWKSDYDWDISKFEDKTIQETRQKKTNMEMTKVRKKLQNNCPQTQQQEKGKEQASPPMSSFVQGRSRCFDGDSDMDWSWSDKEDSCSSEESGEEASGWRENADLRAAKTLWRRCCKRINPDLLVCCHESRMECEHLSARKVGEPGYAALPVNERNNCDLRRIYEIRFAPAKGRGHPIAAYANIKSTFGQYSRLCVCLKLLDIKDVWKPGAIFRHVLIKDAVFSFISYFRLRGQATTVSNKAANLKMVVEHAGLYFAAAGDVESRAKADELRISLDRARSAERREMRRIARSTKEEREAAGKLLDEGDMDLFAERAYTACRGIIKSAKECKPARDVFQSSQSGCSLINKWCINLLSFLMMVGNGQRPQVYRLLLLPTPEQMRSWVVGADREVSLRTLLEKTPRSMECPGVLFPRRSASLLKFHVVVVRPLIMARFKIVEPGDRSEYPLLVHTKSGRMLRTADIRGTLRAFLTRYDPELAGITPMILRSSFASTMFARFKRGELGEEKSVESFLANLAKLMNSSAEMLMATYIASNPLDFPKTVLTLFRAFQRSEDSRVEGEDSEGRGISMCTKTTPALLPNPSAAAGAPNTEYCRYPPL